MLTLHAERTIQAPTDIIWDVISDVERYAEYAPNLSRAVKVGDGQTPSRRCWDTQGRGWNEACVLWEEGKQYSYVIDTSDYPYPFVQMKGTWGMDPQADTVRVWMRFDYTPKGPALLYPLVQNRIKRVFAPVIEELLDNWEAEIAQRATA
ncbi:MAG: SRPBCC family protein [Chloroflexi bacterium]|nr:SRPBCC family protein [Chloroflexota bacterium]